MPKDQFGDFQTPLALAQQCVATLKGPRPRRVLEPTCGYGSFLQAAELAFPGSDRIGIEIQDQFIPSASQHGTVLQRNIFETDLGRDLPWNDDGGLLVIGNPPWVTSAELNRMNSVNMPRKENFKGAKGMDALLGGSNFDVCEYVITKALTELSSHGLTLGMLCKTHVARNVVEHAWRSNLPVVSASLYRIDAMKWFGAGVDACWFVVEVRPSADPSNYVVDVYDDLDSTPVVNRFGVIDGRWVSDVDKYVATSSADGQCPYEWRSGLKHDASSVFELVATPQPVTKAGEPVDVEGDYIYPLLKSTDVYRGRHQQLSKWVIVPQLKFGDETAHLQFTAPKLWDYLNAQGPTLDARKSSIYRNRPRFSVFGHGDYSYAPYKVAVSGLHKQPIFRLVHPLEGKPVFLDDTCYFLPFADLSEAALVLALLNSGPCQALIESLVFWDSKRPLTKKLLARLEIHRLPVDPDAVVEEALQAARSAGTELERDSIRTRLEDMLTPRTREPSLF